MKHYNPSLAKISSDIFNTKYGNHISANVGEIVPVVDLQPYINVSLTRSTTGTIFTTPLDKDFYLTNVAITCANNAASSAGTESYITFSDDFNVSRTISCFIGTNSVGGTVGSQNSISIQFPMRGIRIRKNTSISFNLGGDQGSGFIAGYTVEVSKTGA